MRRDQGFSLVELITVVAIVGIIMALAVPGLQRARAHALAASAIQSLRTITTAQHLYERKFKVYGNLVDLAPEGTIDPYLGAGSKSGYSFSITLSPDAKRFGCNATPQFDLTNAPHFFVDETAVVRFKEGAPADATSQPIPR